MQRPQTVLHLQKKNIKVQFTYLTLLGAKKFTHMRAYNFQKQKRAKKPSHEPPLATIFGSHRPPNGPDMLLDHHFLCQGFTVGLDGT